MKRKQFLALLLSASVVSSTVLPAYAAEMTGETGTAVTTYTEAGEAPVVEEEQTEEETDVPVSEGETTPETPNFTEGSPAEDTVPENETTPAPETDTVTNVVPEVNSTEDQIVPTETPATPANNTAPANGPAAMSLGIPGVTEEKPLQNGADFTVDADNFVGHYKDNGDGTVDLVYADIRLSDPDWSDWEHYDLTNVTVPATVEKDGITYSVRHADFSSYGTNSWFSTEMKNITFSEGIKTVDVAVKNLDSLTLPSSVTSINGMSGTLNDGTPSFALWENTSMTVNFPGNSELVYDNNLRKFYSTNRGSGACDNVGDQFSLYNLKYELVDAGTVDVINVFDSELEDNANVIIPKEVTFKGKTFQIRNAHLMYKKGSAGSCPNMKTLTIEEGVQNVYFDADEFYENVKTISIPASANIASFSEFPYLEEWNVSEQNANFTSVDGVLFNKDKSELIAFPASKVVDTYEVPEYVTTIKDSAFVHNKGIQNLIVKNVDTVESHAIWVMNNVKSIVFEDVANVGDNNITRCANLETVTVKREDFPVRFLTDNPNLKTINIKGELLYRQAFALSGNVSLEEYNVIGGNEATTHDRDGVLYYNKKLLAYPSAKEGSEYVVPSDTVTIGVGAFSKTKNLQKLICPKGVRFSASSVEYPVNPVDVYLSDLDTIHYVSERPNMVFISEVGGHVYAPTQAVLDSINAAPNALDGVTAEIGVIPVESVTAKETAITVNKGKTAALELTVNPTYATEQLTFEGTEGICSVSPEGVVTGLKSGTGTVTVKGTNGVLATINVTVKTPLESMKFTSDSYEMNKGEKKKLELTYTPEDADVSGLKMESSNTDVVKFNKDGEAVAVGAGTAEITATCGKVTAKCKVTVKVPLESISMSETKKTINKGKFFDLDITMNPTDATVTSDVTWSSDKANVATVDQNGKVTAVGAGTAIITAELEGKTTTCEVTVEVPLESIVMSESAKTINKGESFTLSITKNPTDTTVKGETKWSSSDTDVAVVDKDGKVTAKGAGTAVITANLDGKETTCKVTVKVPLESISLNETAKTVNKGESFDLDVTMNPIDATVSSKVQWNSDNGAVATIDKNGKVKAVGAGTATITANLEGKTATCVVTVKVPLNSIKLTRDKASVVEGGTLDLDVLYNPTDTTVTKDVTWTSDDTEVTTVDQNGQVTAKAEGTATITAEVDGKKATCKITVTKKPIALDSIELSEKKLSLDEGEEAQLTVKYNPSNATVDKKVNWSSSNTKVATVDATGKITAVGGGTATITAEAAGKTAICQVTVKGKEIALDSISLSETNLSMTEGDSKKLNVTYNPTNTTVDKTVAWSSDNAEVAAVDQDGNITAKGAGTATITAKVAGKKATCTVTVSRKEIALDSIEVSEKEVLLDKGDTKELTVKYNPTNTTVDKAVTWTSDNPDVATVDKNGKVTAKAEGTAFIYAEVSGKKAVCKVTVKPESVVVDPEEEDKNDGNGQTSSQNNDQNNDHTTGSKGEQSDEKPSADNKTANDDNTPKTGDPTGLNLLFSMLTASAAGIGGTFLRRRKKDELEK